MTLLTQLIMTGLLMLVTFLVTKQLLSKKAEAQMKAHLEIDKARDKATKEREAGMRAQIQSQTAKILSLETKLSNVHRGRVSDSLQRITTPTFQDSGLMMLGDVAIARDSSVMPLEPMPADGFQSTKIVMNRRA